MGTPPYAITGNKEGSTAGTLKTVHEKQELEKHFLKIEKLEKFEHKEKPEKHEHKEKPEKHEHKEKPEKFEHKEFKEKLEVVEKAHLRIENLPKEFSHEGPDPLGSIEEGVSGRLAQLEQTVGQLQHFITTNLRPDLSQGALKQEPDAGDKSRKA